MPRPNSESCRARPGKGWKMRLWIWRDLRLELPDDWEMLQFTKDRNEGKCAFGDRNQFRLEMNWQTVPGRPDFDRMLSDYSHKLAEQGVLEEPETRTTGDWRGIEGRGDCGVSSRYGRYFPDAGLLMELVFLWPGEVETNLQRAILSSAGVEQATEEDRARWRCFGMDIMATKEMALTECNVQPALARMKFGTDAPAADSEWFERMGMVENWLKEPVRNWLNRRDPEGLRDPRRWTGSTGSGHSVEFTSGAMLTRVFPRIRRVARDFHGAAWICPSDGRLYAYGILKNTDGTAIPANGVCRLRCCKDMEAHGVG